MEKLHGETGRIGSARGRGMCRRLWVKGMRVVAAGIAALTLASAALSQPVKLPDGTAIPVAAVETITSGKAHKGDAVEFRVREDVKGPNQEVLIKKGAKAFGTVVRSKGRGMFGKNGELTIRVDYVVAVDGVQVKVRGQQAMSGRNNEGAVIATAVLVSVLGVFIHGRDVSLEEGKELVVYTDGDFTLKPSEEPDGVTSQSIATPTSAAAPSAAPANSVITLKDGDRITGTIRSMENGVYTVLTSRGELRIKQEEIKSITTSPAGTK